MPSSVRDLFDVQENCSHRYIVIRIRVTWSASLTLKCRAVTCTKAKLTCMEQVHIFTMPLDCV